MLTPDGTKTLEPSAAMTPSTLASRIPRSPVAATSAIPSGNPTPQLSMPGLPSPTIPTGDPRSHHTYTPPETKAPETRTPDIRTPDKTTPPPSSSHREILIGKKTYSYIVPPGFEPDINRLTEWRPHGLRRIDSQCVSYRKNIGHESGFVTIAAYDSEQPISVKNAEDRFRSFILEIPGSKFSPAFEIPDGAKFGCEFEGQEGRKPPARFDNDLHIDESEPIVILVSVFTAPEKFDSFRDEFDAFMKSFRPK
jgi:hypothetical protein